MKTKLITTTLLAACLAMSHSIAQQFNPGSDGSYGPLNIATNTSLDLPTNGIFQCTTITIATGATLSFRRNPLNTPVYLLATGDVNIDGVIDVSGADGRALVEGLGGPGGFDGGKAGFLEVPPGAGYGPGGGRGGSTGNAASGAGSGSYASVDTTCQSTNKGTVYGSPLLVPLVGGSGSGGTTGSPGSGGGGGGGAILIASKTRINIKSSGAIRSTGGVGQAESGCNSGSGGGIRLVAPVISGDGTLDVRSRAYGGGGRIRIDTLDRRDFRIALNPSSSTSMGSMMLVFPFPVPRLDILEAAGTAISEGTPGPVYVQLPYGSPTNQTVKIQARNFNRSILVKVVLTPDSGAPIVYDVQIDNSASNPALATVNVGLPVNQRVTVNAWKR